MSSYNFKSSANYIEGISLNYGPLSRVAQRISLKWFLGFLFSLFPLKGFWITKIGAEVSFLTQLKFLGLLVMICYILKVLILHDIEILQCASSWILMLSLMVVLCIFSLVIKLLLLIAHLCHVPFLCSLKMSENQSFSRGIKMGHWAKMG